MKPSRVISLILVITVMSVFYVWQQTQIVKLAYERQNKLKLCYKLLDQNMLLRYNLLILTSYSNLSQSLEAFDTEYEVPHFSQIVDLTESRLLLRNVDRELELKLSSATPQNPQSTKYKNKHNIFLSLFGPKSQAEAHTRDKLAGSQ